MSYVTRSRKRSADEASRENCSHPIAIDSGSESNNDEEEQPANDDDSDKASENAPEAAPEAVPEAAPEEPTALADQLSPFQPTAPEYAALQAAMELISTSVDEVQLDDLQALIKTLNDGVARRTDEMQRKNECIVCNVRDACVVFVDCKHCVLCETCAQTQAAQPLCPKCRAKILNPPLIITKG